MNFQSRTSIAIGGCSRFVANDFDIGNSGMGWLLPSVTEPEIEEQK
jgi:hypothetical protein